MPRRAMPLNGIARNVRAVRDWSTACGTPSVSVAKPRRRRCPTPFGSVPVTVCVDSSIETEKRADMESALTLIAVLAVWWLLQVWLLPRLGVPT
jgi:hypothetical protein